MFVKKHEMNPKAEVDVEERSLKNPVSPSSSEITMPLHKSIAADRPPESILSSDVQIITEDSCTDSSDVQRQDGLPKGGTDVIEQETSIVLMPNREGCLLGITQTLTSIRSELEILGIEITTRSDSVWVGLQLQRLGTVYTALEDTIQMIKDFEEANENKNFSRANTEWNRKTDVGIQACLDQGGLKDMKGEVKEESKNHAPTLRPPDTVKIEVDPDTSHFHQEIRGLQMVEAYINNSQHVLLKADGSDNTLESKLECHEEIEHDDELYGVDELNDDEIFSANLSPATTNLGHSTLLNHKTKNKNKGGKSTKKEGGKRKSFLCHVCHHEYSETKLLKDHLANQHPDAAPPTCQLCNKSFLTLRKLSHHNKVIHSKNEPLSCDFCNKVFNTKQTLKRHRATHTGEGMFECDTCHKKYAIEATLKSHVMAAHMGIKPFNCETCGKAFAKAIHLKTHQVVHTGEKPFKCDLCDKSYSNSGHLWTHKATTHEGFKKPKAKIKISPEDKEKMKIMCGECGKLFASSASLKVHEKMHTGEGRKKIMCQECGKWFASSISLRVHERIHTGEKPYKCELCTKAFAQYSALIAHQDVHNREQKYTCHICSKSFYHKVSLNLHLKRHTAPKSYPCDVCGKSFTENYNLKRHQITHTGEKPFACDICGRGFTQPQLLKQHMPVHTGERAFKCDICSKAFTQSSSLSVHKKKYH